MATRYVSEEKKIKEGRGTGRWEDYKPWINACEIGGTGTVSTMPDWKHGRAIQCLSQGELFAYALLRWQDDVDDILEQYPLHLDKTTEIARRLGYRVSNNGRTHMTTDFVVVKGRDVEAYSIKPSRNALTERDKELQKIEEIYWKAQEVPWHQWFSDEMDKTKAQNILDVVSVYNKWPNMDDFAVIRHLLAHKIIEVDMSQKIEYKRLIEALKENGTWTEVIKAL